MSRPRRRTPDPTGEQGRPLLVTGFVLVLVIVLVVLVVVGALAL
jgi:hypothetical protein